MPTPLARRWLALPVVEQHRLLWLIAGQADARGFLRSLALRERCQADGARHRVGDVGLRLLFARYLKRTGRLHD